jgi:uncharacterized membrane protein
MAMAHSSAVDPNAGDHAHFLQPGVDLRWPACAIWRPGEPAVRAIGVADLRDAIRKGLEDFNAVPTHVAILGIIYAVLGLILFRLAFGYDVLHLIYPMLAGFALIGPFAAIFFYQLSRRREQGLDVSPAHLVEVFRSPSIGAIFRLGVVLTLIFLAWVGAAQLMYVQIMGGKVPASFADFLSEVLTTPAGHQLILVGNTVGFVFALVVLVISVVSFPMLVDRNVSAATAVRTSVRAVIESPLTMAVWGLIVLGSLILGALPLFFGLAVIIPVLGHATWHLYRKTVSRDDVI